MKIVIACAGKKSGNAGHLRNKDGSAVNIVARPELGQEGNVFARPDDLSDHGMNWRNKLEEYNGEYARNGSNPWNLVPAWKLYKNPVYSRLVEHFGEQNIFILSAGWGLLSASYLTPLYDITFAQSADRINRRSKSDAYADQCSLNAEYSGTIVFLGGKDYLSLFCKLTSTTNARRVIFYNSVNPVKAPDCEVILYKTKTRTNWHYEAANSLMSGQLDV